MEGMIQHILTQTLKPPLCQKYCQDEKAAGTALVTIGALGSLLFLFLPAGLAFYTARSVYFVNNIRIINIIHIINIILESFFFILQPIKFPICRLRRRKRRRSAEQVIRKIMQILQTMQIMQHKRWLLCEFHFANSNDNCRGAYD